MTKDEIVIKLEHLKRKLSCFKIISLYIKNTEDQICYSTILEVIDKINNLANKVELTKEEYNVMNNDYDTLLDLIYEFEHYPLLNISIPSYMMLNELKIEELDQIYDFLSKNNLKTNLEIMIAKIKEFITLIDSLEEMVLFNTNLKMKFESDAVDIEMGRIDKMMRSNEDKDLKLMYIKLKGIYFDYLNK